MKNKFLKLYLMIFGMIVMFTSAFYIYGLIDKLNLPKGIISSLIDYIYLLIHIGSFVMMLHYGNELLVTKK